MMNIEEINKVRATSLREAASYLKELLELTDADPVTALIIEADRIEECKDDPDFTKSGDPRVRAIAERDKESAEWQ